HISGNKITQSGVIVGTYGYLSPEAFGDELLDARTDLWAFGIMLFEMLTGYVPFKGDTASAIMVAMLTAPVPDLEAIRPDVPPALIDLIYRMLEKDREQRIPSARVVGAEL